MTSPFQRNSFEGQDVISAGQPQAALPDSAQQFLQHTLRKEPTKQCCTPLEPPSRADLDTAAATATAKQNGLKAMPLQQDSAVSGNTAEGALACSWSHSPPSCMEQKHGAPPQQMQGAAVQRAASGSIDASSSPKSGSNDPISRSPAVVEQNHLDMMQQADGGAVPQQPGSSAVGPKQHTQQQQQQVKVLSKQQDPTNMPIARFDPSLVAAVKCAADILQTDDGWSKEEAAATIAALTAKFQNAKNRSAAAAAASAGRAATGAVGVMRGMLGQPGGGPPGSLVPQNLHSIGGQANGMSALLPRQDPLAGGPPGPRLHPFLPSLGTPAVLSSALNARAAAANSQPADAAAAEVIAVSAGQTVEPVANGLARAYSIPGWRASAGQATGNGDAGGEGHSTPHMQHSDMQPVQEQPQHSDGAGALGAGVAASSSSTGAPAGCSNAPNDQQGRTAEAEAAAAAAPEPGAEAASKEPADCAGAAAESGFGRKASVTSSGLCSVMEPRQLGEDAAAGEEAEQQQQHEQQQHEQQPVVAPTSAGMNRSLPGAAAVAAAAAKAAAVHAALQQQEEEEQQQQNAAAAAAALQLPGSQKVNNSVMNVVTQPGSTQAGDGQLPMALLALLQSDQQHALPLMSALLRSGNLRQSRNLPAVAESLKARLAGYLQQQQGAGAAAGLAGAAGQQAAAGTGISGDAAVPPGKAHAVQIQQDEQQQMQENQQPLQEQQQGPQQQQSMESMLQQQKHMQSAQQQLQHQYHYHEQQQQQQERLQYQAPAESDSRSAGSIAAALSHASADAAEPAGRRKRGRQPSAKAAAAIAAKEEQGPKRQARGATAQQDAAAAPVQPTAVHAGQKAKRGRPSKANRAAAKAADDVGAGDELQRMHSSTLANGFDGMYDNSISMDAHPAAAGTYLQSQLGMGHPVAAPDAAAAAAARPDGPAQDQQSLQQLLAGSGMGQPRPHSFYAAQQQQDQKQQALQAFQQQQQLAAVRPAGMTSAAAAAAQQQFQQQLQQLPPINTTSAPAANSTQQLLQQLQQLPPTAAQQVAKIAQTMPPDLPPQMRQSLLRWAVNTVTQNMGLTDEANSIVTPAQQQQPQQQPQQQQQPGNSAAMMWGAAPAAATAAMASAEQAVAAGSSNNLQQQGSTAPPAAGEGGNAMSGLLAAAQAHPGLKNMKQQDREAFLKRLLQQRNARLFSQGNIQQPQLDPAAAAAAPAPVDSWPMRPQHMQQEAGGNMLGSIAPAGARQPTGLDTSWANEHAALVSQPPVMPGFNGLDRASSLSLPQGAAAGASGIRGAASMLQHAATMPEGMGDASVAAAVARAAAVDGGLASLGGLGAAATAVGDAGSMHPGAMPAPGPGSNTAAAAAAVQRPHYMQNLEYQLQLHGMSKKQLLEMMKEVGPLEALKSIGMHQSVLQGQAGPTPAAATATPAAAAAQVTDPAAAAAMPAMFNMPHHQQQQQPQHFQHVEDAQQQMQQQQMLLNQQQQALLNQRLQQLASISGSGASLFNQQQQQQQVNWMLHRTSSAAALSPFGGIDTTGLYNNSSNTGSNYGSTVNGLLPGMAPPGNAQAMAPNAAVLANSNMFDGQLDQQMASNTMMPAFPSSYDPAAAAAAPVPVSAAAAVAASRLQMAVPAAAGSLGAYPTGAGAGMQGGGATNWMPGAGMAGFGANLGQMGNNHNSHSAALDPPVLELPDHGQGMIPGPAAAAAVGAMRPAAPQQHGHHPGLISDLPGSLLGIHNDGEDLLGSLGLDIGEVDNLLAGMDTGGMGGLGGDQSFGMAGGGSAVQSMLDVWTNCRTN